MRKIVLVAVLALTTTGCATMFNARKGPVTVQSDRPGTAVQGESVLGAVPGEISGFDGGTFQVVAEGCQPATMNVSRSISGWFWVNLLSFYAFPVGMIVDAATGSMWKYNPTSVHANCQPGERGR